MRDKKSKWSEYLPYILYTLAILFFVWFVATQDTIVLCFGALFLIYGSMLQGKKPKDSSGKGH